MIRHRYMLPKYQRQEYGLHYPYKEQARSKEKDCGRGQIRLNETPTSTKPVGVFIFKYP